MSSLAGISLRLTACPLMAPAPRQPLKMSSKSILFLMGLVRLQTLMFYFCKCLAFIPLAIHLNCSQFTSTFGFRKYIHFLAFLKDHSLFSTVINITIASSFSSRPQTLDWVASLWSCGGHTWTFSGYGQP